MNVLQLISSSGFFGAENVVVQLAKELGKNPRVNALVGVFQNTWNPHLEILEERLGAGVETATFLARRQLDLKTLKEIRHFVRQKQIDIIHSHGYKANFYARVATLGLDTALVATCHNWPGKDIRSKGYACLDFAILFWFDQVAAVSDEIRKRILRHGVPPQKVTIVRNGISLKPFQENDSRAPFRKELGISFDSVVVGTVGRISPEKGHENLLIAAREISEKFQNVVFLLLGDGPLKAKLQREYSSPTILFTGYRKDLPSLFSCMDIFVLPSLVEGLPMAALEAMASRLPVVASGVGEVPSLVGRESGMLVEPNNPAELKRCLIHLIENPTIARIMGEKGYRWVKSRFSADRMALKYREIYREVIRRKKFQQRKGSEIDPIEEKEDFAIIPQK